MEKKKSDLFSFGIRTHLKLAVSLEQNPNLFPKKTEWVRKEYPTPFPAFSPFSLWGNTKFSKDFRSFDYTPTIFF